MDDGKSNPNYKVGEVVEELCSRYMDKYFVYIPKAINPKHPRVYLTETLSLLRETRYLVKDSTTGKVIGEIESNVEDFHNLDLDDPDQTVLFWYFHHTLREMRAWDIFDRMDHQIKPYISLGELLNDITDGCYDQWIK